MTVSEQIIQVLDALCEKFGMAIDWTSENVIPYITTLCMKLVSYQIWTSVAEIVLSMACILTGMVLLKKYGASMKKAADDDDFCVIFPIICLCMLFGVGIIMLCVNVSDIIKCLTFPEMYIFEYVQGMINGG